MKALQHLLVLGVLTCAVFVAWFPENWPQLLTTAAVLTIGRVIIFKAGAE